MKIIENYKMYLETIKAEKKETIEKFVRMQCEDDAMFAKIELNIIEVFEQMFSASEKKALSDKNTPMESLKNAYLGFFEKIPTNWHVALEKSIKFGNDEETHKETLKINQADAMKTKFIQMYEEAADDAQQ